MLRKAATGSAAAGALWVAPSVLSLDAAFAAGTCPGGSLNFAWSSGGGCTRHTDTVNPLVSNVGGPAGVDVRIISVAQSGVGGSGLINDNWMTRSGSGDPCGNGPCGSTDAVVWAPRGAQNSFYALTMAQSSSGSPVCSSAGPAGRWVEVRFGFFDPGTSNSRTVRNLNFSLLDVDQSASGSPPNYIDRIYVSINGNSPVVAPATTGVGNDLTFTTGGSVSQFGVTNAVFQGSANVGASSTAANVDLQFRPTLDITSVTVRFQDQRGNPSGGWGVGGTSAPQTIQWVGIGDLSFCRVV